MIIEARVRPDTIPNPEAKCAIVGNTAVFNRGNGERRERLDYQSILRRFPMFMTIGYIIIALVYLAFAIHHLMH